MRWRRLSFFGPVWRGESNDCKVAVKWTPEESKAKLIPIGTWR